MNELVSRVLPWRPWSHFHSQNLTDDFRGWRRNRSIFWYGRCWFYFGGTRDDAGTRGTLRFEWMPLSGRFSVGVEHTDEDYRISICLALFSFWIGWEPRSYHSADWEYGVTIHHGSLWWNLGTPTMEWSSRTPRWRNGSFNPLNFLLGRREHTQRELRTETVVFNIQPEGVEPEFYDATALFFESTWKRPRWLFPQRMVRCTFEVDTPGGIPVPGKGENAWDCDDDAIFSQTSPASTLDEAVTNLIESVHAQRLKYGGPHWRPQVSATGGR